MMFDDPAPDNPRPKEATRNILAEERLNAAFLVVLCSLCCLWIFQGAQALEKSTKTRQTLLNRLWELRQESRRVPHGVGSRHLQGLDGLFSGYRVVLRMEAALPMMCLEPKGETRRH